MIIAHDDVVVETGDHVIVGGANYGQGSSREHAAIAPRYLGLRVVVAKDYARIHWQNLVNFGILPLTFADGNDLDGLKQGSKLRVSGLHNALESGTSVEIELEDGATIQCEHALSSRQIEILRAGGLINWMRDKA